MMVGMMVQVVGVMRSIEAHILVSQLLIADTSHKGPMVLIRDRLVHVKRFARCFRKVPAKFRNLQFGIEK
jgi:hypothetical protein